MVKIAPPRQSVVRLFFVVVALRIFSDIFAVSKILAGNSPAGPPINLREFFGPPSLAHLLAAMRGGRTARGPRT